MKLKSKVVTAIATELFVLLILPFLALKLTAPHEAMGIMILFFFAINPIAAAAIHAFFGKEIKALWWLPIVFAVLFLVSYWLVLQDVVWDLSIYAAAYLIIGYLAMGLSWIARRK